MRVLLFEPRFAALVADGRKRQTIRATARCTPGDRLSLRRWSGKPYRSSQIELARGVCAEVLPVSIGRGEWGDGLRVGDRDLGYWGDGDVWLMHDRMYFARADGFESMTELLNFFRHRKQRGKPAAWPFTGFVIRWEPAGEQEQEDAEETEEPSVSVASAASC